MAARSDRFRNRLMIPIARDTGTVIAFGGRALEADQQPKYLNSPETPIYTKSRTLYGLNLTKGTVRKGNFALIVEGYFDFAQVHQAGGFPVIATCGTALTSQQAQMLRRFAAEGGALLRRRSRRPDRRRAQLGAAGKRRLRRQRSPVAGRRGPRHVHPEAGPRRRLSRSSRQSRPYLEFLLDRAAAEHDLTRDDSRREFLRRMLGVAARIPDPAVARSVRRPAGAQGEGHGRRGSSRNQESGRGAKDRASRRAGADPPGPHPKGGERADLDAGPPARPTAMAALRQTGSR